MTALVAVVWQTILLMLGLSILGSFGFVAWIYACHRFNQWRKPKPTRPITRPVTRSF